MAQSTTYINGDDFRLELAAADISYAVNLDASFTSSTQERQHKDQTAGWVEPSVQTRSGTLNCSALWRFDATNNDPATVFGLYETGASTAFKITNGNAGDSEWSGNAVVTEFSIQSETKQDVTFSFTLTTYGAVTDAVIV